MWQVAWWNLHKAVISLKVNTVYVPLKISCTNAPLTVNEMSLNLIT